MKKYAVVLAAVLAVGVTAWLANAQTTVGPRRATWQYASLFTLEFPSTNKETHMFNGGELHVSANSLAELYKKITGRPPIKAVPNQVADCTTLDVLNALGAAGWELMLIREDRQNVSIMTNYYFKRPAS